jgi:uncharacterized membrane protein YvbJ
MTYCQKCGTKNEDDAEFCKKCGATLDISKKAHEKEFDRRCEDECAGGKGGRGWAIFWGVIIILVGLFIILEMVFKNMLKLDIMSQVEFGWIIAAVIGIFIVILGVRIISRR